MGYAGGISILPDFAKETRDEIQREVVRRFQTQAGYQTQMDWKLLPKANWRGIYAFVMLLGYSRTPYLRFTNDMTSGRLLACYQKAFEYFGGIPAAGSAGRRLRLPREHPTHRQPGRLSHHQVQRTAGTSRQEADAKNRCVLPERSRQKDIRNEE